MASGSAVVKAVPSGDTVVLLGRATSGTPPEIQITLSSLQAPRMGRQGGAVDEPFAWASRDFLRSKCIGKTVTFQVEYRVAAINRDFGRILMDGENLGKLVVQNGWCKVKPAEQSRDGQSQDYEELVQLESQAQAAKIGLWTDDPALKEKSVRPVVYSDFNSEAILNEFKGMNIRAVIEHVRDGSSFRVMLLVNWTVINMMLSGIQCPRVNTAPRVTEAGQSAPASEPEPFALEAKYFTETRLLNRELDIMLEGIDKFGNFYGTVLHPQGNISVELLRNGLARMVDWSVAFCQRETAGLMRNSERQAKLGQLKLWRGWVPPQITGDREFVGTVIEVVSGDMLVVKIGEDPLVGEEKRVSLSSIRAPKVGNARRNQPDDPYAVEAKDFLRQKAIGKQISVTVEYMRDMPAGGPLEEGQTVKRPFATMIVGKGTKAKNLAEQLVAEGMAQVVRHRQDEERSAHYEALLAAESQAIASKKGMHKPGPAPVTRITDLTNNKKQALQYLPFLQRQRTVKAYVDYVFAGSRFKVYIPKENCAVMFALTTVRSPQPGRAPDAVFRNGRKGDPFGEEAKNFSRLKLMQRNVDIVVVDMDKNGVALGSLMIGTGEDQHDYALDMLEAGLAKLDERASERLGGEIVRFQGAQDRAKSAKIGVWSVQSEEDESEPTAGAPEELMSIKVSDIVDGSRFFFHVMGSDGLKIVEREMEQLLAQHGTSGAAAQLKKGSMVAALFDDGSGAKWYRAKILSLDSAASSATVTYVDHGNIATVPFNKTRPLPPTVLSIPPSAKEAILAAVVAPSIGEDYGRDAGMALSEFTWGRELLVKIYGRDEEGRLCVVAYEGENNSSINESMVRMGLCRLSRSKYASLTRNFPSAREVVERLQEAQQVAKKSRANIWRYGDIDSDEDER